MADALRDPATTLVVAPTQRLAHWLRRRHAEDCLSRGLEVWRTPDIVGYGEFLQRAFEFARDAGRLDGRWLAELASRLAWDRIVRDDPASAGVVAPGALARSAGIAWQTLHDWDIPLAAVEADGRPEAAAWTRWAREYDAFLDAQHAVDAATVTTRLGEVPPAPRIELAGFDRLTPAQRSLLERFAAAGSEVVHRTPVARRGATMRVDCRDRRDELQRAARWAAARLDRDPTRRLAIVVPDLASRREEVRRIVDPLLVPEASIAGGPVPGAQGYEIGAARSIGEQPVVAAALEVLDALQRPGTLARASRLLRSGYLGGVDAERDARARLDAWMRRHEGPDLDLRGLARIARARGCPGFADALDAALVERDGWPRRAPPSRWAQTWAATLAVLGWPGPGLASEEHQALERWNGLLGGIGAGDEGTGPLSAGAALALLRDQSDALLFEPQSPPSALSIVDASSCAGMDFDEMWVVGLESGRWPPPASPDPFLPREWQVRRGLPGASAELAAAEARAMLERLRASADEVVLSVPALDGEATLLPSALLLDLPVESPSSEWAVDAPAAALHAARPALESLVDGTMPGVAGTRGARGGSQLLALASACPFRAHAEQRLGARALDEPALGVAATDRGELVHAVLAHVWRELGSRGALAALSPDALDACLRGAIEAESAALLGPSRGVMRRLLEIELGWLEARVRELLGCDLERTPFEIHAIEEPLALELGGLALSLRVDRIDRLPDGSLAVIDYKTGADADPKAWFGERPELPQLPLYVQAVGAGRVGAVAFGRLRSGEDGYRGVVRDAALFPGLAAPGARSGWPKEYAGWDDLVIDWGRRLEAIAREYARGDARLAPDPTHACRYCHLASLCRIHETAAAAEPDDD